MSTNYFKSANKRCLAVCFFCSNAHLFVRQILQMIRDVKAERHCLETMVTIFGNNRTDVWLRYMKFERSFGEPKNVSKLYEKAMNRLEKEYHKDFLTLHNLFISGVV